MNSGSFINATLHNPFSSFGLKQFVTGDYTFMNTTDSKVRFEGISGIPFLEVDLNYLEEIVLGSHTAKNAHSLHIQSTNEFMNELKIAVI